MIRTRSRSPRAVPRCGPIATGTLVGPGFASSVGVSPHRCSWLPRSAGSRRGASSRLEAVAGLHSRFECIHPFLDGNGRTGRLILNLLLVRLVYPPAIIYKRQRTDYLRALRRADGGDPGSLGELLARAILDNLYKFVVPAVAGPARLVPLAALATSQISADALRVAAFRGRLQASRGADGQWRSSRNWVHDYIGARWQRESQ